jgi:hypothetical protein
MAESGHEGVIARDPDLDTAIDQSGHSSLTRRARLSLQLDGNLDHRPRQGRFGKQRRERVIRAFGRAALQPLDLRLHPGVLTGQDDPIQFAFGQPLDLRFRFARQAPELFADPREVPVTRTPDMDSSI